MLVSEIMGFLSALNTYAEEKWSRYNMKGEQFWGN